MNEFDCSRGGAGPGFVARCRCFLRSVVSYSGVARTCLAVDRATVRLNVDPLRQVVIDRVVSSLQSGPHASPTHTACVTNVHHRPHCKHNIVVDILKVTRNGGARSGAACAPPLLQCRSGLEVSAPDCADQGSNFESHRGRLCLSRMPV